MGLHAAITERILVAALKVHSALGAGCLESTYDACLCYQLTKDGINFAHQVRLPILYDGIQLEAAYRIDFVVEHCVIVELKAVESGHQLGLIVNFNVPHLRDGIRRVIKH